MPQFENKEIAGYRIFIYGAPREENPPHFHVVKNGDTVCRFTIRDFKPLDRCNIKRNRLKELKTYWKNHNEVMLQFFCKLNPKLCESRD